MDHPVIAVLTGKSRSQIIADGGSGSWVLNLRHARKQQYAVCVRNDQNRDPEADEPHGLAFLVGRVNGLVRLPERNGIARWRISFSDYAVVSVPGVWKGWRNPVRYTTMEALGIDLDQLSFEPMPPTETPEVPAVLPPGGGVKRLTIAEAKEGLAATFGVDPDAIEITIRG